MNKIYRISLLIIALAVVSCKVPMAVKIPDTKAVPASFGISKDSTNSSNFVWSDLFKEQNLKNLITTALQNNQELLATMQEIEMAKNDIRVRKGALLPMVGIRAGAGVEKVGLYTSQGAGDASTEITPGNKVPEVLQDYGLGLYANWEVDIWKKLRNAKKAAITRYLATIEGKNFVVTNLISEIANSYYELLALDSQLEIVKQSIQLQQNALEIIKIQKEAAKTTELAVQKFQAEVFASKSMEYQINQQIIETENRINFMLGRYPEKITRDSSAFLNLLPVAIQSGIPSQLLINRPDVKQAELNLTVAKLDVKVARAEFFPSLGISSVFGLQAFKPSYLVKFPESLLYNLIGDVASPLINRNAIKAEFASAKARQLQALYNYDKTVLNAYLEVSNQLSNISNLEKTFSLKSQQVAALNTSISVAGDLFKSARADYFEVLMTQRDALSAKLELIDTKKNQLASFVNIYRALGGGWK